MHPALFYRPGIRLSLTELCAARLDGDVMEIGEGYMPADTVETGAARAASIADLVPRRTAASGPTAAWLHGAGDRPPSIHHVTRISPTRFRPVLDTRVCYHERSLPAEDVEWFGGVALTTPLATAVTLAFDVAHRGEDDHWLGALLALSPDLATRARERISTFVRHPGTRASLALLSQLIARSDDQDVVTR